MAEMTFFHYIHRDTVLHRMDGRFKLLCMLLLSLSASFASQLQHYLVLLFVVTLALLIAKLPFKALLKDLKFFGILILIVFVVNAFNIPGDPIPNFPITSISLQGVITGLRFAARLTIIIIVCAVLTGTTPLMTLRNVIEWYLRPLPFVPEVRIATMINLTFMLIPLIFDNFAEMMKAQKARCVELRKNPIKRINFIVFPLLNQTLRRVDEIAYAMEARCYSEVRTRAVFKSNKIDWLLLAICLSVFLFVIL
ncbi:MAG TPA: energy-coupling factor transporter transmembrane protein EcfT [Syntrophomonadaceae bacterium]|nr:energy-coupling factor transporter transmembrane protein EcfT [Syntrophomonadaceae bacterium]